MNKYKTSVVRSVFNAVTGWAKSLQQEEIAEDSLIDLFKEIAEEIKVLDKVARDENKS